MNRPQYIALGLVLLFTVIMLSLPSQFEARLKRAIGGLYLPFFGLAASAHYATDLAQASLRSKTELARDHEKLQQENAELKTRLLRAEAVEQENSRLRELVGWQQRQPWRLRLARVVLRDPANWWRTVHIDLGSQDGVRPDMPVLTPDGLVGRVASVSLTRSQVVLIGDPNCKVAARVENEGRETGILAPGGPLDRDLAELRYLSRASTLKPGQLVRTSGEGGIFPRGIPIGVIVDYEFVESGLATVARVQLAANLAALDEVFVLLDAAAPPQKGRQP